MGRAGYSRAHYRRLSNGGPDTAEAIAWRVASRKANDQAVVEMFAKFVPFGPENASEADQWRTKRAAELTAQFLAESK